MSRLFYILLFFLFLSLAGAVMGACVGEFVGLVIYAGNPYAVYALPVGALVGAIVSVGISLSFVAGMHSIPAPRTVSQPSAGELIPVGAAKAARAAMPAPVSDIRPSSNGQAQEVLRRFARRDGRVEQLSRMDVEALAGSENPASPRQYSHGD